VVDQPDLFADGFAEVSPVSRFAAAGRLQNLHGRFAAFGVSGLDEGDTLALVLDRCLQPGADAVGAADALLARFGGVARVLGAPEPELARVVGALWPASSPCCTPSSCGHWSTRSAPVRC
jgi:hypothetical protein